MLTINIFLAHPQTDQISHALKYFLFPFDNQVKVHSIRSVYFWSDSFSVNLDLHIRNLRLRKTGLL